MSKMDLHDRTFSYCMTDLRVATQFFVQYLPPDILNQIDLSTLLLQKDTYVDAKLRKSVTDRVYSVQLHKSFEHIYLLIDHKSKPEPLMPVQMMRYVLAIMHDHARIHNTDELPMVYPLIFYHGKPSPYPYARSVNELIAKKLKLLNKVHLLDSIPIIDLKQITDEELRKYPWSGWMSFVMKHRYPHDISERMVLMQDVIEEILQNGEKDFFAVLLEYIFKTARDEQYDKIIQVLQKMSDKSGEVGMTIAEMLMKRGHQEGRQEGCDEGKMLMKHELAERMLQEGMDLSLVARITGLSVDELKRNS